MPHGLQSHKNLDDRGRKIGRALARGPFGKSKYSIPNQLGHRADLMKQRFKRPTPLTPAEAGRFGGQYRRVWNKQDELVSAATVRSFLEGVSEELKTRTL